MELNLISKAIFNVPAAAPTRAPRVDETNTKVKDLDTSVDKLESKPATPETKESLEAKPSKKADGALPKSNAFAVDAMAVVFGQQPPVDLNFAPSAPVDVDSQSVDTESWAVELNSEVLPQQVIGNGDTKAVVAAEFLAPTQIIKTDDGWDPNSVTDELTFAEFAPPVQTPIKTSDDFALATEFASVELAPPVNSAPTVRVPSVDLENSDADLNVSQTVTAPAANVLPVDGDDLSVDLVDPKTFAAMVEQLATDLATPEELLGSPTVKFTSAPAAEFNAEGVDLVDPKELQAFAEANAVDLNTELPDVNALATEFVDPKTYSQMVEQLAVDLNTEPEIATHFPAAEFVDDKTFEQMQLQLATDLADPADFNAPIKVSQPTQPVAQETTLNYAVAATSVDQSAPEADLDLSADINTFVANNAQSVDEAAVSQLLASDEDILSVDLDTNVLTTSSSDSAPIAPGTSGDIKQSGVVSDDSAPQLTVKQVANTLHQVADRMEALAATRSLRNVTIQLDPVDLGTLTLVVKQQGKEVNAEIYASHEGVRAALEATKPELNRILDVRGLNLNSITVNQQDVAQRQFADPQARAYQMASSNNLRFGQFDNSSQGLTIDQIRQFNRSATGVDLWI